MIPFLFIGGGLYFLFDALGNKRPSVDPADLGLPTKGFRGYRKGAAHYARGGKTPKLYAVLYLHSEPIADVEVESQDEKAALKKFQDMGVKIPPNSTIRFQKNEPYYYAKGGVTKSNPYEEYLLSSGFEKSYEIKKDKFTEYRKGKWYCWIDERTKEVEVGKYDKDYSPEDVKKYGGIRENNSPYYHTDKYTNSLSKFKKFLDDNYILGGEGDLKN